MYTICKLLYIHILRVFYIELILLLVCTSILRTIRRLVFTIRFLGTLLFSVRIDGNKWSSVSRNRSNTRRSNSSSSNGGSSGKIDGSGNRVGPVDVILLVLLRVLFAVVIVVEVGRVVTFSSVSRSFVGFSVHSSVTVACRSLAPILGSWSSTILYQWAADHQFRR
jgi:hypothetical protein